MLWDNITNGPYWSTFGYESGAAGILYVTTGSADGWRTQTLVLQNSTTFVRQIYPSNTQHNTPWRMYYDTSSLLNNGNNLSTFASALGVIKLKARWDNVSSVPSGTDMDTLTDIGMYAVNSSTIWSQGAIANAPSSELQAAMVYVLEGPSISSRIQFIIDKEMRMFGRTLYFGSTASWYRITTTVV